MLSLSFGLIMFICIVPCMIITFIQIFPKNWQSRNLIFGVKNREEYKTGEAKETVEKIYAKHRGAALKILIVCCVIACLLLLPKRMMLMTTIWTSFVFMALGALMVPLFLGNKEMKDLKRRLGLSGETNVTYVEAPPVEKTVVDLGIVASVEYDPAEASYVEKTVTLTDEQINDLVEALDKLKNKN